MKPNQIAKQFTRHLRNAGVAFTGFRMGELDDKATWSIDGADPVQAAAAIASFTFVEQDETDSLHDSLKTILIAAALLSGANPQQAKTRAMAAYRQALGIQ